MFARLIPVMEGLGWIPAAGIYGGTSLDYHTLPEKSKACRRDMTDGQSFFIRAIA
jgi:hypothetical protein